MTLFKDTKHSVESTNNSNFYFNRLDWPIRIWLSHLCKEIDIRMEALELQLTDLVKAYIEKNETNTTDK